MPKKYTMYLTPSGYYNIKYADSFRNTTSCVTSHRNLSQFGTCYGSSYERSMLFGDTLYKEDTGKWVGNNFSNTYKRVHFPNKLFRFVRS